MRLATAMARIRIAGLESDGGGDGVLFGADGETVGGVFYVQPVTMWPSDEEDGGADAEVAVGGVGVARGGDGSAAGGRRPGQGRVDWYGWMT